MDSDTVDRLTQAAPRAACVFERSFHVTLENSIREEFMKGKQIITTIVLLVCALPVFAQDW